MPRRKYYSDEERLIARRKVPDTGAVSEVTKIKPTKLTQDELSKDLMERVQINSHLYFWGLMTFVLSIFFGICIHMFFYFMIILGFYLIILSKEERVLVQYKLSPELETKFKALTDSLINIKTAQEAKVVRKQMAVRERTHGNSARILYTGHFSVKKGSPKLYKSNYESAKIPVGGGLYFLLQPDRIFYGSGTLQYIPYKRVRVDHTKMRYLKEGTVQDSLLLEYTWQNVNKDGSRDRRFKYNRKIPVYQYGNLSVFSPDGINIEIICSNNKLAEEFARAYRSYVWSFTKAEIEYYHFPKTEEYDEEFVIEIR